ncbi:MAG: hypothetical protein IJE05_06915 [Clostridia bacterium]|nr:hypothetical protein [Clostridia bacterium]
MRKGLITSRLIYSIIASVILTNMYIKTPNGKLILFPFMICSFALTIKYIFMLFDKDKYARIFNKIYTIGFLLFMFGFLIFWCYKGIVDKQYSMLIFSIPFWIAGIYIIRKRFRNNTEIKESSKKQEKKLRLNFPIVMICLLVGICLISGILMLFFGIRDTYRLNILTKNYLITNGYYYNYEIYSSDKDGTTYKLYYKYTVDDKEYTISTDYGTNYIPDENSIREVKYNPNNSEKAILVGSNSKNGLIYAGAFFTFGALTFVIVGLSILGVFDKIKIDIVRTYIGCLFTIIGIGVVLLQNGTTMSFIETIKNMKLWILIPIMFVVVGIHQLIQGLKTQKN